MNDWRMSRFQDPNTEVLANYLPIGRIGRDHLNLHISLTTVDPVSLPDPPAHSVDHTAQDNPFRSCMSRSLCNTDHPARHRGYRGRIRAARTGSLAGH
jgi:hypothetical protein